jgi:hypothetical protein
MEAAGRLQDGSKHISNIKHPVLEDEDILNAVVDTARKGYNAKINLNRIRHHFKLFRRSERNLHDAIFKTIFISITQNRMKKIIFEENKRMAKSIGKNI